MARTCSAIALTLIILMLIAVAACSQKNDTFVLPTRLVLTTPTETATASATATETPIPTATATTTPAPPTGTFTPRFTPSNTFSPTPTPSDTPPATPTLTAAPTLQAQLFGILSSYIDQNTIVRRIADLENFDTRHTNSMRNNGVEGIDAARLYLSALWTGQAATCAASASFYEDAFTITYRDVSSIQSNLVLEVRGTQPGNGVIIVGAHYDTISKDERLNPYGFQPGADDNASGVSATMELARLYCLQPRQKTVVFVLFAAEEIRIGDIAGRQGSRQFVNRFIGSRGWHVDAMINLDTIGSATDTRGELVSNIARLYSAGPNDSPSRQLARRIQAAAFIQLPDFELNVEDREDRENRWGDHMSFTGAGYAAARLIEGSEDNDRQDTSQDLLNDIDPPYLIKNMQVVLAFLLSESEGTPPPQRITVNGTIILWEAVPDAQSYVVAQRQSGQTNYTYTILPANKTGIELVPNTIFSIGTIGSNGLMGSLSPEYISSF